MSIFKKPPCLGYHHLTDCGYEYDCEYEAECCCSDCICGKHGWIDPRTGLKFYSLMNFFKLLQKDIETKIIDDYSWKYIEFMQFVIRYSGLLWISRKFNEEAFYKYFYTKRDIVEAEEYADRMMKILKWR